MVSLLEAKLLTEQFQHPPVLIQNKISIYDFFECKAIFCTQFVTVFHPKSYLLTWTTLGSHVMFVFAYFFDLCRPILERKYKQLVVIEPIFDPWRRRYVWTRLKNYFPKNVSVLVSVASYPPHVHCIIMRSIFPLLKIMEQLDLFEFQTGKNRHISHGHGLNTFTLYVWFTTPRFITFDQLVNLCLQEKYFVQEFNLMPWYLVRGKRHQVDHVSNSCLFFMPNW